MFHLVRAVSLGLCLLAAGTAHAQTEPDEQPSDELVWPARSFAWYDYTYTGALVAGATVEILLPPGDEQGEASRSGGILFDDALRDEIVLGSEADRHGVATAADIMMGTLITYSAGVLPGVVVWGVEGSGDAAWQMTMINLQSFAFSSLVTGGLKRIVDRERPVATECRQDPAYDDDCGNADSHHSFPSGHASLSFTAAVLTCMHHLELDILGTAGDTITCTAAMTMASFTAMSRMASDKHYASDVIAGAAIGGVSGALMPWLLYYRFDVLPTVSEHSFVVPLANENELGLSYQGLF